MGMIKSKGLVEKVKTEATIMVLDCKVLTILTNKCKIINSRLKDLMIYFNHLKNNLWILNKN